MAHNVKRYKRTDEKTGSTDRICQGTVTTSKIDTDFGISSDINVTVWTVVTVTDALQEVATCRHFVWCNTVRERTISDLTCATQEPRLSHNNKHSFHLDMIRKKFNMYLETDT